jgi:hypothetical protein
MQMAVQRARFRDSSSYFRTMFEKCRALAASARNPDDQAYWLGLAQIWGQLADRDHDD